MGGVSQKTLSAGVIPNTLRFYAFLATFCISAYYLCRELGNLRTGMPGKVLVSMLGAIAFLISLSGLGALDQSYEREITEYQKSLVAGRLGVVPEDLFTNYAGRIPVGATPAQVLTHFPDSLPSQVKVRRDGTAYQNVLYWLGPGTDPIGIQVSYTSLPNRVTNVEVLPRARPVASFSETAFSSQPEAGPAR